MKLRSELSPPVNPNSGRKLIFQKMSFFCFSPIKMWLLKSFSKVVVAGPFKSEAEMAKKLGVSQQYVNRKIRAYDFVFHLDGEKVLASREPKFASGKIAVTRQEDLALHLGVSPDAVAKVLRKKSSGFIQTPKGEVKIQRLKPGEKPTFPAVRVLWNDDTEKQDFFSFAAAAKELKIDPKTIPTALKAGKDSFTRKSDGKKFTIEIPGETTRLKPKPLSEEEKAKRAEAKRRRLIKEEYRNRCLWSVPGTSIEEMESYLENVAPEALAKIRGKSHPPPEETKVEESPPKEVEKSPPQLPVPVPAPRKKVPVPAPRKKVPVPAPRKKVPVPASPPQPPRLAVSLPPTLGGRAVPVFEEEIFGLQQRMAKLLQKNCFLSQELQDSDQYRDMLENVETLERQEKLYVAMREKYIGWFLDNEVDEVDETKMVLFNPDTGEDVPVENYEDIANYFLSKEYVDFLSRVEFDTNWHHGRLKFPATTEGLQEEVWMRYIFIKDPLM